MFKAHVFSTTENDWVVDCLMCLAGRASVKTECAVKHSAIPFLDGIEFLDEICVHLIQERNVLGNLSVVLLLMRKVVGRI